ncbi:hypothetical protein J31TS4_14390 [Paenibacillus sp. J31TS4]|uniref:DUF1801 domain-containing protein n=1 Tax=Paenibacillus sp. J31TS4 TaxID=2807195 RepID=UPI001B047A17|nr:DUF1801 domain-containing protein [Paenibacillus sp. J31TS4]GIP38159.1 hypothetical protein J31TS4_14390 [Paenibacillus sp. J31TS4]
MPTEKREKKTAAGRVLKPSGPEQVAAYLDRLDHPRKAEIEAVRRLIFESDDRLAERIKWNAPSFHLGEEDVLTFQLRAKDSFLLVLHRGAKRKEAVSGERLFEDTTGLLEWAAPDRATIKLTDMADVEAKRETLTEVVRRWIEAVQSS